MLRRVHEEFDGAGAGVRLFAIAPEPDVAQFERDSFQEGGFAGAGVAHKHQEAVFFECLVQGEVAGSFGTFECRQVVVSFAHDYGAQAGIKAVDIELPHFVVGRREVFQIDELGLAPELFQVGFGIKIAGRTMDGFCDIFRDLGQSFGPGMALKGFERLIRIVQRLVTPYRRGGNAAGFNGNMKTFFSRTPLLCDTSVIM